MKAVLDTNVLVSALLQPRGIPARILAAWRRGDFELLTSSDLLGELADVISRPSVFRRLPRPPADFLEYLPAQGTSVAPDFTLDVLEDEPDNRVLEAAVAGDADVVVTGDAALLALGAFRSVRVVSPAQFLAELEAR